jgi:hypothetical protein
MNYANLRQVKTSHFRLSKMINFYSSVTLASLLKRILVSCLLASCGLRADAEQFASNSKLDAAIAAFAKDEPGPIDLGEFMPVDSQSVKTVLSFGNGAVPELVKGLKSPNALIVAQSAYCLDCLHAKDAAPDVQKAHERFLGVSHRKRSDTYAIERTRVFLIHYAGFSGE